MTERMTGKRALLEMLKAEGVTHIFGNPGTSEDNGTGTEPGKSKIPITRTGGRYLTDGEAEEERGRKERLRQVNRIGPII